MQHEIGGLSGATGQIAAVFDADDGALGLVTRAAGGREAVSLALDGVGEVWLDPVLKRAVARVDDWTAFCTAPAARLRVRPSGAPASANCPNCCGCWATTARAGACRPASTGMR